MDQNALEKIGIDFENGIGRFVGMFHTMHEKAYRERLA